MEFSFFHSFVPDFACHPTILPIKINSETFGD